MFRVEFLGTRGSTPCAGQSTEQFGGHTACLLIEVPNARPILIDLGTGVRRYGERLIRGGAAEGFDGVVLLSHLHWDHLQGLPFFAPIHPAGARLEIHGPPAGPDEGLADSICALLRPPFFPVEITKIGGDISFNEVSAGDQFVVDGLSVRTGDVPHCGPNLGFRLEFGGASFAYVSDHQEPADGSIADSVLELARDVDVLVHDAQYTRDELLARSDWGHSSVDYAVDVARAAGVGSLILFHHDPAHDDATVAAMASRATQLADGEFSVKPAHEGLIVEVQPASPGSFGLASAG